MEQGPAMMVGGGISADLHAVDVQHGVVTLDLARYEQLLFVVAFFEIKAGLEDFLENGLYGSARKGAGVQRLHFLELLVFAGGIVVVRAAFLRLGVADLGHHFAAPGKQDQKVPVDLIHLGAEVVNTAVRLCHCVSVGNSRLLGRGPC
jgi:hypothetical protein